MLKDRQSYTTDIQKNPLPIQEWVKQNEQLFEQIKEDTKSKDIHDKKQNMQQSKTKEQYLSKEKVEEGSERE